MLKKLDKLLWKAMFICIAVQVGNFLSIQQVTVTDSSGRVVARFCPAEVIYTQYQRAFNR